MSLEKRWQEAFQCGENPGPCPCCGKRARYTGGDDWHGGWQHGFDAGVMAEQERLSSLADDPPEEMVEKAAESIWDERERRDPSGPHVCADDNCGISPYQEGPTAEHFRGSPVWWSEGKYEANRKNTLTEARLALSAAFREVGRPS